MIKAESIQINGFVRLIDDERVDVLYKEIRLINEDRNENNVGKLEGYINIVYPFAGLDLNLTLEVYTETDEYGDLDGFFNIPFADKKMSLNDVYYLKYVEARIGPDDLESEYDECSCGGNIKPMYEEFPNWITFCDRCDGRSENTFASPIKETC